ncbi:unnamed protein product, partial [Rotaria socialis]
APPPNKFLNPPLERTTTTKLTFRCKNRYCKARAATTDESTGTSIHLVLRTYPLSAAL